MMSQPFPHRAWYCRKCKEHKEPGTERSPLLYCIPCSIIALRECLDGGSVPPRFMQTLRWYIARLEEEADEARRTVMLHESLQRV